MGTLPRRWLIPTHQTLHEFGQIVATGGDDCKVNVWRVTNATSIRSLSGHNNPVDCLCFDENEEYIASGSQAGGIRIHDLKEVGIMAGRRCLCGGKW